MSAIELDLGAIRRNTVRIRSLVAPARLLVVVKGNAYGHGAVRVARAVAPFADAIGVYNLQEALELRTAGISTPLVILGAVAPDELGDALRIQAAIPVWTTGSYLTDLERTARAASSPFAIHAKIDTGLARFGFSSLSATSSIAALRENPTLRLTGVFTHFAAAEEMNSAYTKQQLSRFLNALRPLEERRMLSGVVRHAAASASAILS
ncbi:MAG TPA: alanine racemase, partial [Candidatus Baltobacteraceae bacterium]|nr:alanine racemase [Candidatus Baltobacteraceae bacterium]